jgi:hypothetical protein
MTCAIRACSCSRTRNLDTGSSARRSLYAKAGPRGWCSQATLAREPDGRGTRWHCGNGQSSGTRSPLLPVGTRTLGTRLYGAIGAGPLGLNTAHPGTTSALLSRRPRPSRWRGQRIASTHRGFRRCLSSSPVHAWSRRGTRWTSKSRSSGRPTTSRGSRRCFGSTECRSPMRDALWRTFRAFSHPSPGILTTRMLSLFPSGCITWAICPRSWHVNMPDRLRRWRLPACLRRGSPASGRRPMPEWFERV